MNSSRPARLAVVLHAHLPFVRHPEHDPFLEEGWLYEAIVECYLPLLEALERLERDGVPVRLTMTLSPTLCEMLDDALLMERAGRRMEDLARLAGKEPARLLDEAPDFLPAAEFYAARLPRLAKRFERLGGRILPAFRRHQDEGRLEILTCAATHAVLPLLGDGALGRVQVGVAADNYARHFGRRPRGIWLPECGYAPGVEDALALAGIEHTVLEAHGLTEARPSTVTDGILEGERGVLFFARDPLSSRQVWSRTEGYPGDFLYREYYRDAGYDAPYDYIRDHLHPDGVRRHVGLKYHRITGEVPLGLKEPYDPDRAGDQARAHADHFVASRLEQARSLGRGGAVPVLVSPYDAELFGHWWFEGPIFLEQVFRSLQRHREELLPATLSEAARNLGVSRMRGKPAASTWGEGGDFRTWLNGSNDGLVLPLADLGRRALRLLDRDDGAAVVQLWRELLLAQSSDWPFILNAGQMPAYAGRRVDDHLEAGFRLAEGLEDGKPDPFFAAERRRRWGCFPELNRARLASWARGAP